MTTFFTHQEVEALGFEISQLTNDNGVICFHATKNGWTRKELKLRIRLSFDLWDQYKIPNVSIYENGVYIGGANTSDIDRIKQIVNGFK